MENQLTHDNFLQEDFQYFFEQSLSGFLIASPNGIIKLGNTKLASLSGYTKDDLKGKKFVDLLSIGGKIYYETHLWPMLRMQGYFDEVALELSCAGDKKLRILVNAVECRDKQDKPVAIHYTILKATDRLKYEQNLQQAKIQAEEALLTAKETVVLREQLISVLGHDLRNPLSAMGMAADMLQESKLNDSNAQMVAILKRSSLRMSELVNNVMDFARTRLGEGIILSRTNIVIEPVLQQVVSELQLVYPKRKIVVACEITKPVSCDPDRIAQLLSNLLANALTHGSADTPVYMLATDNEGIVKIIVSNQGAPIPESLLKNLFAPFTREASRPSQNGLGLGLYISSEIARAHNASLTCTSSEEETQFIFTMHA